jgi:hypothetical protein
MAFITTLPKKDRYAIRLTAEGMIAETFPMSAAVSGAGCATGDVRATSIGLRAGDIVASITVALGSTPGSGVAKGQLALYSKAGVLLANSADTPAAFQTSNAYVTLSMSAAYTVPTDDGYYCAMFITGTTMPTVLKGYTVQPSNLALGSGMAKAVAQTGQASLPGPATFTASALGIWFGVS